MKKQIHPQYTVTQVTCACGNTYSISGTRNEIAVEMCRNCSPLFTVTEEKKVVMGQMQKFLKRQQKRTKTD